MEEKSLPRLWDRFLKEFLDELSRPSSKTPSVRCLTRTSLSSIIAEIQKKLELPSTFPSGVETLKLLSSMGLASTIATETGGENTPSKEFYMIGISDSHNATADPFEILQAYKQDGVICFFSALSYYELTTQFPTHHHIATIVEPSASAKTEQSIKITLPAPETKTKESSVKKLGTLAFSYDGTPFYTTKRKRNTIPGIKTRRFNPRTEIKITSKEQTLLDTLQYPLHCGGPAVVFEAWQNQLEYFDEQVIIALLQEIDNAPLTRRLGTLFDFLEHKPQGELLLFLEKTKEEVTSSTDLIEIPLLRGINYSHLNRSWKTLTP